MSTNEPPPEQQPTDGGAPPPPPPPPPSYGAPPPPAYGAPGDGGYGGPPPPPAPAGGAGGYSVGTAWGYGWNKFTANLGPILLAVLILVGVQIVVQVLSYMVNDQFILRWIVSLVGWVVSLVIGAGIVRAALMITDGRELEAGTVITPHKLPQVIIASLITGVLTFIGLLLCVIPGLLVAYFTSYTLYFLMDDEQTGAMDAIKASFDFTKSNVGNVILWFLLSLLTTFVGALLCGIGLIAAIPVVIIGTAYTYRTLSNRPVAA